MDLDMINDNSTVMIVEDETATATTRPMAAAAADSPLTVLHHFDTLIDRMDTYIRDMKTFSSEVKSLKKKSGKLFRSRKRGKQDSENCTDNNSDNNTATKRKEPSGFTNPVNISHELADFLDVPRDSMIPRSEVTKKIFQYVKDNNLKHSMDGRKFDLTDVANPRAQALKNLLHIDNDADIGYFTLQKYLKVHISPIVKKTQEDRNDGISDTVTEETTGSPQQLLDENVTKKKKHTLQFSNNKKRKPAPL